MQKKFLVALISVLFVTGSCRKESVAERCDALKTALASEDNPTAGSIIDMFIAKGTTQYTEANLTALADLIAGCGISTSVLCFDCIKTLPSQSEIWLSFTNNGQPVQKTIDISYTPVGRMQFVNLHD